MEISPLKQNHLTYKAGVSRHLHVIIGIIESDDSTDRRMLESKVFGGNQNYTRDDIEKDQKDTEEN